jgi:hypothetical protein
MSNANEAASISSAKYIPSMLEKLVDGRFLILLLCMCLYADIWFLEINVDPRSLSLSNAAEGIKNASVFSTALFLLSYALLMGGFFPVFRKFVCILRTHFSSSASSIRERSKEEKQLSDWSLAFIILSVYDAVVGHFYTALEYKGLVDFILDLIQHDGFSVLIFRISVVFLWFVCAGLACMNDSEYAF